MRSKSFIGAVAAVLGLTASTFSTRRAFDSFTSALKQTQWHNPARLEASQARQQRRQQRNLRDAQRGAFGPHWMAL